MNHPPQQMTLALGADSTAEWIDANAVTEGWRHVKVHHCALGQSADARFYMGDGPNEGQIGIHVSGCWYHRDDAP